MNLRRSGWTRTRDMASAILAGAVVTGCGPIKLGSSSPNEPAPSAPIVAQGSFTSLNGQTVTGTAIIYSLGGSSYIARLSGITAPSENGLQVVVVANGVTEATFALLSSTGSENYPFSLTAYSINWNQVNIHSTVNNEDYGEALLTTSTNPTGNSGY